MKKTTELKLDGEELATLFNFAKFYNDSQLANVNLVNSKFYFYSGKRLNKNLKSTQLTSPIQSHSRSVCV